MESRWRGIEETVTKKWVVLHTIAHFLDDLLRKVLASRVPMDLSVNKVYEFTHWTFSFAILKHFLFGKMRLKRIGERVNSILTLNFCIEKNTAMPYGLFMIFIETSVFTKYIQNFLSDGAYAHLQHFLKNHPEAGDLIPAAGGVRKIRWSAQQKGKRGGLRIIYYWKKSESEIWMLTVYAKSQKENIPAHILKQIVEGIKDV